MSAQLFTLLMIFFSGLVGLGLILLFGFWYAMAWCVLAAIIHSLMVSKYFYD
jgi:hypothetical protein